MLVYYINKFSLLVMDAALVHSHQLFHMFSYSFISGRTQIRHRYVCPEGVLNYQIGQFTFLLNLFLGVFLLALVICFEPLTINGQVSDNAEGTG
jgi:hypothetical protein